MKIKTRRYYVYYLLRIGLFLGGLLPIRILLYISEMLGKIGFKFAGRYADIAVSNLSRVFPDDESVNTDRAEKVFINFVKNGAEWLKLISSGKRSAKKMIKEVRGREYLDSVMAEGKGAVVIGFHFGNWELLGIGLKMLGYEGALVARKIYFDGYDRIIRGMREKFGARVIYRDESPRKMLAELKSGNVLGIVPDQDVDRIDGVFIDFLGMPAYTPTAPVKLASSAGTSIVPIVVVRDSDDRHVLVVEKPIRVPERSKDENIVRECTQKWNSVLEGYVRRYPEQWVWVHERWKTVPEEIFIEENTNCSPGRV